MTHCILGVHDGHNASAALMIDGEIAHVVQEERLCRVKNQPGLLRRAILEVLDLAGLETRDVDAVALASHNMAKIAGDHRRHITDRYQRAHEQLGGCMHRGKQMVKRIPFAYDLRVARRERERRDGLNRLGFDHRRITLVDHHTCHAASTYFSMVTYLMGMVPLEHEYKLMGLAGYVDPDNGRALAVRDRFRELFEWSPTDPCAWRRRPGVPTMIFGADRLLDDLIRHERFDLVAGGLQMFIEEFLSEWVIRCIRETGIRKLAVGGGVFMNVKLNHRVLSLARVRQW